MKITTKIVALAALLTSTTAFAANAGQVAEFCCALGACCGLGCC